ncbi:MAG TPA: hypothetical protein VHP37_24635 [Burkholderiales bacterium]|nr:hypothetical protein [Burkholderiales bacterium]
MTPRALRVVLAINHWLRLPLPCKLGLHGGPRCKAHHWRVENLPAQSAEIATSEAQPSGAPRSSAPGPDAGDLEPHSAPIRTKDA